MIVINDHNFYWFLIGYVVAVYVFDWVSDWAWFKFVDWYLARANKARRGAKGPAWQKQFLTDRAGHGVLQTRGE